MKEITLTQDKVALVDDCDYDELAGYSWSTITTHNNKQYAIRVQKIKGGSKRGKQVSHRMHRVIWQLHNKKIPKGMEIDHINGDGLDNRSENLRLCTRAQNCYNSKPSKLGCTSRYKGVHHSSGKWKVQVQHKHVGSYATEIEAAQAYNRKAREIFGEHASLNDIAGD